MFECVRSEVHVTTERLKYKGVVSWEGEVELVLECPCSAANFGDTGWGETSCMIRHIMSQNSVRASL